MKNWQKIYTTTSFAQANIIKGMLEENDIPVQIVNKQDSNLFTGNIELHIPAEYTTVAKELLKEDED